MPRFHVSDHTVSHTLTPTQASSQSGTPSVEPHTANNTATIKYATFMSRMMPCAEGALEPEAARTRT